MSTRQILDKTISDAQAVIDEAKAKLAEIDKPKLRHGDYGHANKGECEPRFWIENDGELFWGDHEKLYTPSDEGYSESCTILGNFLDDIAERGKELADFKMCDDLRHETTISIKTEDDNVYSKKKGICVDIGLEQEDRCCDFIATIDEAEEIHRKLGQVIRYAKNRK